MVHKVKLGVKCKSKESPRPPHLVDCLADKDVLVVLLSQYWCCFRRWAARSHHELNENTCDASRGMPIQGAINSRFTANFHVKDWEERAKTGQLTINLFSSVGKHGKEHIHFLRLWNCIRKTNWLYICLCSSPRNVPFHKRGAQWIPRDQSKTLPAEYFLRIDSTFLRTDAPRALTVQCTFIRNAMGWTELCRRMG